MMELAIRTGRRLGVTHVFLALGLRRKWGGIPVPEENRLLKPPYLLLIVSCTN